MKYRIAILFCVVLLAALLPLTMHSARAEETSGQCGDSLYWSFDKETGTLTITGSGDMWDYEGGAMPWEDVTVEYVDSYGGAVLRDDPTVSLIHYIILPEGLTSIASGAFCGTLIESIEIPSTVKSILYMAFASCENLKSIAIPDGISKITWQCFSNCGQLESVTLPVSVTEVYEGAFWDCNAITDVYYQGTAEQRAEMTFGDDNEPLLNATWHYESDGPSEPVTGQCGENLFWSFDESTGTLTITGSGEMDDYTDPTDVWEDEEIREPAWYSLRNEVLHVVMENGITYVGEYAFVGCCNLTTISVPASVKTLSEYTAFEGCTSLSEIQIDSENTVYRDADGVLLTADGSELLFYPRGNARTEYAIPSTVTSIHSDAFAWNETLLTVTIPDSVTEIGGYAFYGCTGLQSIAIPDSVTEIGGDAFSGCTGLQSVTIGSGIKEISLGCFAACTSLTEIQFCEVKEIHDNAFENCESLETLVLPDTLTKISWAAFIGCENLKTVTLGSGITYIGENAFFECSEIVDVYYNGTETQKAAIEIAEGNEALINATWHYLTETIEGMVEWNSADVQFKGSTAYVIANGSAQMPRFTVKNSADGAVIDPEFYDYEYRENTNAGTGYVIVTFKGEYSGTCRGTFKIYLPPTTSTTVANVKDGIKLTWAPVEGAAGYVIYRRAWSSTTGGWTDFVRWNNTTALEWLDKTVYAGTRYQYGVKAYFARRTDPVTGAEIGGNVGDNFNLGQVGPLKTTVRITTRTLKSVTPGAKQLTVKWAPSSQFTGYQVQYATNSAFMKGLKTVKITNPKTSQTVIKSLKTGTTYYVRIRSYHEFNGMTYYGEWSNALSGKVK